MIEILIDNRELHKLKVNGSVPELCADLLMTIHLLHSKIASQNLMEGLLFERILTGAITDIAFQPMEDDARHNEILGGGCFMKEDVPEDIVRKAWEGDSEAMEEIERLCSDEE